MNYMEHELYRWSYMTDEELCRRLNKIKNIAKLHCFIHVAEQNGKKWLKSLAEDRLTKVMNGIVGESVDRMHRKLTIAKEKERVLETGGSKKYGFEPDDLDRYLDI